MSVTYSVSIEHIDLELLGRLGFQKVGERLIIGTSFWNAKVSDLIRIMNEQGATEDDRGHTLAELTRANSEYVAKFNSESPTEFFDTPKRFSWYDMPFGVWDTILKDDTPLMRNDSTEIQTWGDLKNALCGEDAYMQESKFFAQGSHAVFSSDKGTIFVRQAPDSPVSPA